MENKQYIIFDLDGTLVDSFTTVVNACKKVLKDRNVDMPNNNFFESYHGKDMETMFADIAEIANMNKDNYRKAYDKHYAADVLTGTYPIQESVSILQEARHQGIGSIVISNKKQELAELVCDKILGAKAIDIVIGRKNTIPIKPRHVLLERLGEYGIVPSVQCLRYYGDSETDCETAKLLNIKFINIKLI